MSDGTVRENSIDAGDKKAAIVLIEKKGGKIITISKQSEFSFEALFDKEDRKITQADIFLFTKYFGVLLKAGIPVLKCMKILENQMPNKRFKRRITKMIDDVEGGASVYDAFSKYPDIFSNMYINLIKTGEESGLLFDIFLRLTDYIQNSLKLQSKVKSAMVYPVVIMFVAGCVLTFLLAFIVPRFGEIFSKFGGKLPLPTQILLNLSTGIKIGIIPAILLVAIGMALLRKFRETPYGLDLTDGLVLKVPMFGELTKKFNVTRFSTNLSMLLRSGVSITKALQVVCGAVDNVKIKEEIYAAAQEIESGKSIAEAFVNANTFPPMAKQMISVGDETGNLEDMLQNVAEFYEEEVNNLVDGITAMIEPLFILFLGATVGFIVVAMFLPMFKMAKMASH
jgi:type IV pilus assembly protein PilC